MLIGGFIRVCCEAIFKDNNVRKQIEHLRDNQVGVILSDSNGNKCKFGLVATFYPTNDKREVILRCQECGKRWMVVLDRGDFRVAEA